MITEIIRELTVINRTNEITNEYMLSWAKIVEEQRTQEAILDITNETEFNMIKTSDKHESRPSHTKKYINKHQNNCKCCNTMHESHKCLAYGRNWVRCK